MHVTALVAWASLPSLCWTRHPRRTRIAVSIANWRLPRHNTIMKRHCMWRCHQAHCCHLWFLLPYPAPFPGDLAFMSGQSSAGSFAGVALASSSMLRWRPCKHCVVVVASVALALLPTLCWPLCPHCTGIAPSIANWHLPNHNAVATRPCAWHCCRGHCPCLWPHCRTRRHSMVTWPWMVRLMQHWHLCWHCAGVLAHIVPASLPTLRCCCCRHCAGVIAIVVRAPLPLLRGHCCPCCLLVATRIANWHLPSHKAVAIRAGVITSIAPSSLPALHRHCCPCRTGVFALVALALLPLSHPRCCQHHELASAQS
jgi:hypothetical protein